MVPTVLRISNIWGDVCFYRMKDGKVQALRQATGWGDARGYRPDLDSVISYFCADDPDWSYEWVEESEASYATEG